jgi:hypothetical protein
MSHGSGVGWIEHNVCHFVSPTMLLSILLFETLLFLYYFFVASLA